MTVELDLSAVGLDQSGDGVEGRGFSCSIRPEQTDCLPAAYVQAPSVYDRPPTIGFLQAMRSKVTLLRLASGRRLLAHAALCRRVPRRLGNAPSSGPPLRLSPTHRACV